MSNEYPLINTRNCQAASLIISTSVTRSSVSGRFGKQDFAYLPEEDAYRGLRPSRSLASTSLGSQDPETKLESCSLSCTTGNGRGFDFKRENPEPGPEAADLTEAGRSS